MSSFAADVVRVQVIKTRPGGVWVKLLTDNRVGFIRKRELSWDQRIGVIPLMPQLGEEFDAVIIPGGRRRGYLNLSRCRLDDPWGQVLAKRKYRTGDSVQGDVTNIRHFGVFVQLEPGIIGLVRYNQIPMLRTQKIEDVLGIGDRVLGIIIKSDPLQRKIEMSLLRQLQELDADPDQNKTRLELLGKVAMPESTPTAANLPVSLVPPRYRFRSGIPRPQRFLVVDNDAGDLKRICEQLTSEYDIPADGVRSGKDAAELVKRGYPYGLTIIDIWLDGEHGTQVAERLRNIRPGLPIIFVSQGETLGQQEIEINQNEDPVCPKDPENITATIDDLCHGYWKRLSYHEAIQLGGTDRFIRDLGMQAFARRNLETRLDEILLLAQQEMRVMQALLLRLDPKTRAVSIVANSLSLSEDIRRLSTDALYYSPVRTVIEDDEDFRQNDIAQDRDPAFTHFFNLLEFRSCLGIPILIPDHVTEYGLFLLDSRPQAFSTYDPEASQRIEQARIAANQIAVAVESATSIEHMRKFQDSYLRGEFMNHLVHELKHELDPLPREVETLKGELPHAYKEYARGLRHTRQDEVKQILDRLDGISGEVEQLVKAYQQLERKVLEIVDVNVLVEKVKRQMEQMAASKGVRIQLELASEIPPARAVFFQLEQVLINLVMNSVQQIERQRLWMQKIAEERENPLPLLSSGIVAIKTRRSGNTSGNPIQIRVVDTGPGIHWRDQERIFSMGFTNREGAGLGLYISRNLIEIMDGNLQLIDSLMFVGTEFRIEIPANLI